VTANPEAIEQRVVALLRESVMNHSTRDLDLDHPLGEAGLGLDSLALVQFLTAVEAEYHVRLSLDFWSRADQASLRLCAEAVMSADARRQE